MIAATYEFVTQVFQLLCDAAGQAAVLAAIVWLICRWGEKRMIPQWRMVLWMLVIGRLALPMVPQSEWSPFSWLPQSSPSVVAMKSEHSRWKTAEKGISLSAVRPNSVSDVRDSRDSPAANLSIFDAPVSPSSFEVQGTPNVTAWDIGGIVWLAGLCLLLGRQVVLAIRLNRQRATWKNLSDPRLVRIWEACTRELKTNRNVQLCLADANGPASTGIVRPCVVLPTSLADSLSDQQLRHILLHELMHMRRRDHLADRFAAIVAVIHWFNPVLWLALSKLRSETELACDAAVLARLEPSERSAYGRTVLRIVELFSAPVVPGVLGFGNNSDFLAKRIGTIANFRQPTRFASLTWALVIAVLAVTGFTSAAPQNAPSTSADGSASEAGLLRVVGRCVGNGKPLGGVKVSLYLVDRGDQSINQLRDMKTENDGRFQFSGVPNLRGEKMMYSVVAAKAGRSSMIRSWLSLSDLAQELRLEMPRATTIIGRVVSENGQPIAGADVWLNAPLTEPIKGVLHAKTDREGRYAIVDAFPMKNDKRAVGDGVMIESRHSFSVHKEGYAHARPSYSATPAELDDVVLKREGVIQGRVIDRESGEPVAGIVLSMQGIENGWQETITDDQGRYQLTALETGKYNIWANPDETKTCIAVDSQLATAGETSTAPDIELVTGGWIEGIVVQAGGKLAVATDYQIGLYGPSRPKSGAAVESTMVDDEGRFRMRVPPGNNFPYIMSGGVNATLTDESGNVVGRDGIAVRSGETKKLVFTLDGGRGAVEEPALDEVVLPLPIEEEHEAAGWIRRYGGWYELDGTDRIKSVNMVYHHDENKKRHENPQREAEELFSHLPALTQLKELFLHRGQATDATMPLVAALHNLEVFFIWDIDGVTDVGIKHLAKLDKLKNVHLGNGGLTDASLAVLGSLPNIEQLSLQGNAFTDAGIAHLRDAKQLQSLWIGLGTTRISDAAAIELLKLPSLKTVELQ